MSGAGTTVMKLVLVHLVAACPYRLLDDADHEIAWANDFLDAQHLRQLSPLSLRALPAGAPFSTCLSIEISFPLSPLAE